MERGRRGKNRKLKGRNISVGSNFIFGGGGGGGGANVIFTVIAVICAACMNINKVRG